jgi:hypothetical protein
MSKKKNTPAPKTEPEAQATPAPKTENTPENRLTYENEIASRINEIESRLIILQIDQGRILNEYYESPVCGRQRAKFIEFCKTHLRDEDSRVYWRRLTLYVLVKELPEITQEMANYLTGSWLKKLYNELSPTDCETILNELSKLYASKKAAGEPMDRIKASLKTAAKAVEKDRFARAQKRSAAAPKKELTPKEQAEKAPTHGKVAPGTSAPTLDGLQSVLKHARESIQAYMQTCEQSGLAVYWPAEDDKYMSSLINELEKEIKTLAMRQRLQKAS